MESLLTTKEVGARLGIHPNTVYRLIRLGFIKSIKLGGLKVRSATLDEFIRDYDGEDINKLMKERETIEEQNS